MTDDNHPPMSSNRPYLLRAIYDWITDNNLTVARLVAPIAKQQRPARQPGTLRGTVLHISPDFDAPLDEFRDYMG